MPDYEPRINSPRQISSGDLLHPRFAPALEEKFRIYLREDLRYVPWLMLGTLIIVLVQGVLDRDSLTPEAYLAVTQVRIHILLPIVVAWILSVTLLPPRIAPIISLLLSLALGCALLYMQLAAWQAGSYRPYQTLLLAIFFFQFVNIASPWRDRCLVSLVLLLCFALIDAQIHSGALFARHLIFMTCTWLAGSACAYILEQSSRQAFLRKQRRQVLADTDPLTGLPNRRQLTQRFTRLWRQAKRENKTIALAMVDVDHFKAYNDCYGHIAGDNVLHQVAAALQQLMNRPFDFVARYGGEEFTIVWYNVEPEVLPELGRELCSAIELLKIAHTESPYQHITISMGFAWQTPSAKDTPEHLFTAADRMLYAAKNGGRNQARGFDAEHTPPVRSESGKDEPPLLAKIETKRQSPGWLTVFSSALRLTREQQQQMHLHHLPTNIARLHGVSLLIFLLTTAVASQNYFSAPSPEALHINLLLLLATCVVILTMLTCAGIAFFQKWLHYIVLLGSFTIICAYNVALWAGWSQGLPFPYESIQLITLLMYFAGTQSLRSTFVVSFINTAMFILIVTSLAPPFFSVHEAITCTVGPNALGLIVVWMLEQKHISSFLAYQDIERLSRTDELTGLYNRHRMFENLTQIFDHAIAEHKGLAVAILDIDYFKRYNDNYGHSRGDAILKSIGETLQQQTRRGLDFAARYGGEEFVLVWYDNSPQTAAQLAERTRAGIEALNIPHEFSPLGHVSVSIGLAWGVPSEGLGLNRERALLAQADKALYQAKRDGRNRVQSAPYVFTPHVLPASGQGKGAAV